MADVIEPSHFDVVVTGSGLAEVLLASALARAGKAVLLLDASESYGSGWATLAGSDFVHGLLNTALLEQQQQQQQAPADTPPGTAGTISLRQRSLPLAGAQHCSLHVRPALQEALQDRGLLIDQAPRVLYQDEALVHLLVACQAHNYLEFKLVEGSYIFLDGCLRPVPASRADLFADRALSLADKRSLGRFLAACAEAIEGSGRLQAAFDDRPLADLLAAEGLNQRLQQVVLYGIALADVPQHEQQPQQQQQQQQPDCSSSSGGGNAGQLQQAAAGVVTARQGLAALELYSRSLGRYGGSGAFMAPCYGCGSLVEAFVRLAAVKGTVTALRHSTHQLQLLPEPAEPAAVSVPECHQARDAAADDGEQRPADGAVPPPCASSSGLPAATAPVRVKLQLGSGQVVTAGSVVCSSSCLATSTGSSSSAAGSSREPPPGVRRVARAVALLDRSLVEGDTSLQLVLPPGALGPQQTAVIRGLQLGSALGVAPPQHALLYLSAELAPPDAAACCSRGDAEAGRTATALAEQVLRPALEALAAVQGLQPLDVLSAQLSDGDDEGTSAAAPAAPAAVAGGEECTEQAPDSSTAGDGATPASASRANVLAACFYTTSAEEGGLPPASLQQHPQQHPRQPQQCILQCPDAPVAGFAGFSATLDAAEAAFRQHFPTLPWLTDPAEPAAAPHQGEAASGGQDPTSAAGGGGGGTAAAAAGVAAAALDDDELDAIDELAAALADLTAELQPGDGAASGGTLAAGTDGTGSSS